MDINKEPAVSVILPTFNRANVLPRAMHSVLQQTFQDLELIIVDDGSSDNTREVVENIKDPRVKYLKHDKNAGLPAARNTGLKEARGKFMAFQDDDDQWLDKRLQVQVPLLEGTDLDTGVVYCDSIKMEHGKRSYLYSPSRSDKSGDLYHRFLMGNFVTVIAALVKKECFQKVGMFDERLPYFEDWDIWLRISKYYKFKYSEEPMVIVHFTEGSMTTDMDKMVQARKIMLEKHYDDFVQDKRILSRNYAQLACELYMKGDMREGRGVARKAFQAWPFDMRNIMYMVLSLSGARCFKWAISAYKRLKVFLKRLFR
jgi:glycosyltransferase involved in cell wall biosynthesis